MIARMAVAALPLVLGSATAPPGLKEAMLKVHNVERILVAAPALTWDAGLEASAQIHANLMASTGKMAHATNLQMLMQGENLAWHSTPNYSDYAAMAGWWANEKADFVNKPLPNASKPGKVTGHYTQMIWRTTTRVGCAIKSAPTGTYLVCRYSPPGNYVGQYAYPPAVSPLPKPSPTFVPPKPPVIKR